MGRARMVVNLSHQETERGRYHERSLAEVWQELLHQVSNDSFLNRLQNGGLGFFSIVFYLNYCSAVVRTHTVETTDVGFLNDYLAPSIGELENCSTQKPRNSQFIIKWSYDSFFQFSLVSF